MFTRRVTLAALFVGTFGGSQNFANLAMAQENGSPDAVAAKLLKSVSPLGDRSVGKADAPVVMVVYGSTTCEHSAEFSQNVWPILNEKYVVTGKMRMIFRELPLDNLALATLTLARSVDAEKYFALLDVFWKRQKLWRNSQPKQELFKIMQMTGMTSDTFETVLQDKQILNAIYNAGRSAQAEFGIRKTPTIFINGRLAVGHEDPAEFITMIDAALLA